MRRAACFFLCLELVEQRDEPWPLPDIVEIGVFNEEFAQQATEREAFLQLALTLLLAGDRIFAA